MRRVKIVATVGPASSSAERLLALIQAGADVVRLNFSHGTREEHGRVLRAVREIAGRLGRPVAVLQDLSGPKIRIGALRGGGPVTLSEGMTLKITTRPVSGSAGLLSTTYEHLPRDVRPGDMILLADGKIALKTTATAREEVTATVVNGGQLSEHQGINLPGVRLTAPALTEKDRADLAFGVQMGVDFVALSFVRDAGDVRLVRDLIAAQGADIPVIAKLEKAEAVKRLDEILTASDGVMVARGDLGVEIPLEEVPVLQKLIIRKANGLGIPVITATQMLESMMHNPRPTRAEVSDVANAILDGTDAVMLSGETAVGEYPVEAVQMMDRVARAVHQAPRDAQQRPKAANLPEAICRAAAALSEDVAAQAVVLFTRSGYTARLVSRERPRIPILALTAEQSVYRRLSLSWGVKPVLAEFQEDTDTMIAHAEKLLLARGLLTAGDLAVIAASSTMLSEAGTNLIKLQRMGDAG